MQFKKHCVGKSWRRGSGFFVNTSAFARTIAECRRELERLLNITTASKSHLVEPLKMCRAATEKVTIQGDINNIKISHFSVIYISDDISTLSANMVTQAETLQAGISLPPSAVSLMAALCSAATHSTTPTTNNSVTVSAASCKSASNTDGVQIDIPSHVKAIYLNSSSPNLGKSVLTSVLF